MSDDDDARHPLPADFPSRVAHEIRSPLNLVAGALSELLEADPDGQQRLLSLGRRGVAKLTRLADRLSLLARVESGRIGPTPSTVNLGPIVAHVAERARDRAGRRRVEVEIDIDAVGGKVRGDAELLGAAVEELVDNALAHARTRVSVRTETTDGHVRTIVVNDGRLVAPDDADVLFVLHGTERPRGGLHVGLAIAQAIAQAHGGSIELLGSDEDEGTRFAFVVPAV